MTNEDRERMYQLCELDDDGIELTSQEYEELRNLINKEEIAFHSQFQNQTH